MTTQIDPTRTNDQEVRALLERYKCPVPFHGNRSHSPVHRSNDAESVAVRIAKQGLRVGANRILRLVCLTDSTPT